MFWSKAAIFRTVKFRIALCYAALFTASFAIIFGIVYFHLASANLNTADTWLNTLFNEIEYEYLTGAEPQPGQIPMRRLDKVPAEIYRNIAKEIPGFTPLMALRGTENKMRYTLFGKSGRQLFEIKGEAGAAKIAVQKINFVDRVETVAANLSQEAFGNNGNPNYHLLLDAQGKLLARSPFPAAELPLLLHRTYHANANQIQYQTIHGSRYRIRLAYRQLFNGEVLILGVDMHNLDDTLERVTNAFVAVGLTVIVLSALSGWFLARRMFNGVDRVGQTARKIAAGNYSLRVAAGNEGEEVELLVKDFNFMVENTEKLMTELRTITDNIAHDLRTPLTRMQTCAEVTFAGQQTLSDYRDALADNTEECRRMLTLINTMLDISRAESGAAVRETFDIAALLRHAVELFEMAAAQKQLSLTADLPPSPLPFTGDRVKLQQLFGNLIDNAVKFTPPGGNIRVRLAGQGDQVTLEVSDTGIGIDDADQPHIFKRFYRADRSRNQPGNGLGLSLAAAIVKAHGGSIGVRSAPGTGSVFTIILPGKTSG